MATEPAIDFPEWANLNPTDGVTGKDAVVEPDASKKNNGWAAEERPPRQDFNWLFNQCGLWIAWFKQQVNAVFNNLSNFITLAGVSEDMAGDSGNLSSALSARFNRWEIEGFDVVSVVNNNPGTETTFIFSGGRCLDSLGLYTISKNVLTLTKKLRNASYVKGASGNMLATSAVPPSNGTMHLFVIHFSDDDSVDFAADDNIAGTNAAAMANVDYIRYLWPIGHYGNGNTELFQTIGNNYFFQDLKSETMVISQPNQTVEVAIGAIDYAWPKTTRGFSMTFDFIVDMSTSSDSNISGSIVPKTGSKAAQTYQFNKVGGTAIKSVVDGVEIQMGSDYKVKIVLDAALSNGSVRIESCVRKVTSTRMPWNA